MILRAFLLTSLLVTIPIQAKPPVKPQSIADVVAHCKPAVVAIGAVTTDKPPDEADVPILAQQSTPDGKTLYLYVSGTGFIVSADGYLITAQHVVGSVPGPIPIVMPDGKLKQAKVIIRSTERDFAILKMDGGNFPFLKFGKLDEIKEGDDLIFIGHAFAQSHASTTKGIASWIGQTDFGSGVQSNAIQLNAVVNSGNSGGPLLNPKTGNVIGIIKAKHGRLTPYLQQIKDGQIVMRGDVGGGGFTLSHFVKDVSDLLEWHLQLGIGYAVSGEYAEKELESIAKKPDATQAGAQERPAPATTPK
jgi:S1-C subfamily serine protease